MDLYLNAAAQAGGIVVFAALLIGCVVGIFGAFYDWYQDRRRQKQYAREQRENYHTSFHNLSNSHHALVKRVADLENWRSGPQS